MPQTLTTLDAPPSRSAAFLAPYRRTTSTGRFIPEIDGLRFAAILSVFLYHVAGDVMRRAPAGYERSVASHPLFLVTQVLNVGVPLFFVISGFILSLPFAEAHRNLRKPVSLKQYYWRRVTRIEPPYVLCLLLFFVLKIATGRATAASLLPHLIASSFYMHGAIFGRPSDIFVVAWSLEIEIQFYILAPLLASVFAIARDSVRRSLLMAALLLATGAGRFAWHHHPLEFSLLAYGQFFLAGFLLAEFYLQKKERQKRIYWDALWLAGTIGLVGLLISGNSASDWLSPWLLLLLTVCALLGAATSRLLSNPWIATIGGMCYSLYLLHNHVIAEAGLITEPFVQGSSYAIRVAVQALIMAPIVLAISAVYYRLIERPCMEPGWPSKLFAAPRSQPRI